MDDPRTPLHNRLVTLGCKLLLLETGSPEWRRTRDEIGRVIDRLDQYDYTYEDDAREQHRFEMGRQS